MITTRGQFHHEEWARSAILTPLFSCVTFVTVGELIEWGQTRSWSQRSMLGIDVWLSRVPKV